MIELINVDLRIFSCVPDDLSSEQQQKFRETTGIQDISRLSFAYCPDLDCIVVNRNGPLFYEYVPFIAEYLVCSQSVREELKKIIGPYMGDTLEILDAAICNRNEKNDNRFNKFDFQGFWDSVRDRTEELNDNTYWPEWKRNLWDRHRMPPKERKEVHI